MTTDALLIQIRSLEAQLAALHALLKQNVPPASVPGTPAFAAFYGVLAHVTPSTETELTHAELKLSIQDEDL